MWQYIYRQSSSGLCTEEMDQEQDEGLERAPMMMMVKVGIDGRDDDDDDGNAN